MFNEYYNFYKFLSIRYLLSFDISLYFVSDYRIRSFETSLSLKKKPIAINKRSNRYYARYIRCFY